MIRHDDVLDQEPLETVAAGEHWWLAHEKESNSGKMLSYHEQSLRSPQRSLASRLIDPLAWLVDAQSAAVTEVLDRRAKSGSYDVWLVLAHWISDAFDADQNHRETPRALIVRAEDSACPSRLLERGGFSFLSFFAVEFVVGTPSLMLGSVWGSFDDTKSR